MVGAAIQPGDDADLAIASLTGPSGSGKSGYADSGLSARPLRRYRDGDHGSDRR
jgi:hypothetical protein